MTYTLQNPPPFPDPVSLQWRLDGRAVTLDPDGTQHLWGLREVPTPLVSLHVYGAPFVDAYGGEQRGPRLVEINSLTREIAAQVAGLLLTSGEYSSVDVRPSPPTVEWYRLPEESQPDVELKEERTGQ